MRGANDVEILDQMLTQGLLGAGFKAGKKFGDLTAEQKQLAWQRFRRIGNEVNKVVDTQYALAKNVYQTIKNGLKVTDAQVQQARQTIRQFTIQQEKAPTFYTSGLEPKLVKAHTTLAINAVQKGLVRFEDFAAQMVKDAGDKIKPHLENIYRTVTRQFGLKPDEIGIAKSKLTGRTEAELKNNLDPTVRKGETSAQAQTRAAKAQEEIRILGVLKIYEAIGAEPQKINIAENDAKYADTFNVHTLDRHGASVPLKRTDASVGARTIEGRIYGDPPWRNAENFSYKWIDDSTMNRTINDYIEKNWDTIRWELANNQQLTVTFDAGKAIGEGFYNKNQMGLGISQAEYGQTSYVTLRLKLDQIEPQKVVVETAFPAGRGN